MKCAQCEEAVATIRCCDERLDYCDTCSQQLHNKNARKHHQLETIIEASLCDECESASAKLECLDCGGGKVPLLFCFDCCSRLHSRSARASHSVQKFGLSRCSPVELVVDLGLVRPRESSRCSDVGLGEAKAVWEGVIDLTEDTEEEVDVSPRLGAKPLKRVKVEDECLARNILQTRKECRIPAGSTPVKNFSSPTHKTSSSERCPSLLQVKKEAPQQRIHDDKDSVRSMLSSEETKVDVSRLPPTRARRGRYVRNCPVMKDLDGSEDECSSKESTSESDGDLGGTHKIKRGSVTVEAFVVDATDHDDTGPVHKEEAVEEAASGIRFKIKKMLDLGLHPDTPEIEAQQALKNAQRLLTKHNLEQAEVLKGNLTDTSSLVGGMRVVELKTKGRTKVGRMESWVLELGWVISDNFDTQFYFKAGNTSKPLTVVFYGISQNADCAGYAFAATFNRISIMSSEYLVKSINNSDEAEKENEDVKFGIKNKGLSTRIARANYRRGIVAGLKEAVQRSRRPGNAKPEPCDEKSKMPKGKDCDDHLSFENADEDDDFYPLGHGEEFDTPIKFEWKSMAITALVQHSKKVGEEFLQSKGIKVRKRTQPNRDRAWNQDAFLQGMKDAETIDINQKGLEDVMSTRHKRRKG